MFEYSKSPYTHMVGKCQYVGERINPGENDLIFMSCVECLLYMKS